MSGTIACSVEPKRKIDLGQKSEPVKEICATLTYTRTLETYSH